MLRALRDMSIAGRLWLVFAFAVACLAGQLATSLVALDRRAARTMQERQAKVRGAVETAYGVVVRYGSLADAGKMTRDEAQRAAADALRGIRYAGNEYFFISDLQSRMIMHPFSLDLVGKDLTDYADPSGKRLFLEFARTVRSQAGGAGFVEYQWPKPGGTKPVRKLSFVKLYEPWGWIVGSGLYLDDIDDAASAEVWRTVGLTALVLLLLAGAGAFVLRSVKRAVAGVCEEAKRLEVAVHAGALSQRAAPGSVGPEFRCIVKAMNETMDAFVKPIRVTSEYVDRISRGDIPPPIADRYDGDFDTIKSSLNGLIQMVHMRNEDIRHLIESALAGRLDERADTTRYKGSNGKLLEGINSILDAMLAPIQEATQVLQQLAQRDLRARMKGSYQGDHTKIKDALNATAQALHDALVQVAQVVEQVASSSDEIATSAQSVASGASEQASSLEETSSSLESMASMTKQSTDNAQQANALAQQARAAATEGGAATEEMTGAMAKIKASAEGTSQIIKDINEIAFQTNLLALNAAVEAARAGEAGRGFAVVAEEVRSLALRSKEAANKTEELIRQSVKEAGEGEVTAKHVAEQLSAIVGSISKVSDIVAEIAASSKEQAAGIDQVNGAVADVDKVTQQNAASSEQSSSAAAELSSQSRELAVMIASFQLAGGGAVAGQRREAQAQGARPSSDRYCKGGANGFAH